MIDVEHGALRAFENDRLPFRQRAIQKQRGVADEGSDLLRGRRRILGTFCRHRADRN